MNLNKLSNKHKNKIGVAFIVAAILSVAFFGVFLQTGLLPAEHTIYSGGEVVVSGDTVDYLNGLVLEMDYYISDDMSVECHLWDIEESMSVEVGAFSRDAYDASIWTFTLDYVRNDTNPHKLVLTGDATGESFTFYIMGEEGESEPPPPPPFVDPIISDIIVSETSPNVGEDITVTFVVETYCNYEWVFEIDGAVIDSGIIASGGDYRIDYLEYVGTQTENGTKTYSLDLEYVKNGESAFVSDSIDVTWIGTMPTTTTTTTETETTTTTDTTTTIPIGEEEEIDYLMVGVIIAAVIFVYAMFGKKKGK